MPVFWVSWGAGIILDRSGISEKPRDLIFSPKLGSRFFKNNWEIRIPSRIFEHPRTGNEPGTTAGRKFFAV